LDVDLLRFGMEQQASVLQRLDHCLGTRVAATRGRADRRFRVAEGVLGEAGEGVLQALRLSGRAGEKEKSKGTGERAQASAESLHVQGPGPGAAGRRRRNRRLGS